MMRQTIVVLCGIGLSVGLTAPLMAQSTLGQVLPLEPLLESTYANYRTVSMCAWAHQWREDFYWRDKRPDTIVRGQEGVPYQPSTQEAIRACLAQPAVTAAAAQDELGVAEAALAEGAVDQAAAAFAQLAKQQATASVDHRAWIHYQMVDISITAPQPQIPLAEQYAEKLDVMGAPAAVGRMLAHTAIAREAQRRDSVPLWDREIQRALTASRAITGEAQKEWAWEAKTVYALAALLKERENDTAGARALLTAGRNTYVPLRPAVARGFDTADTWLAMQGHVPGPVTATRWVGNATDTLHPVPGKPAVIIFGSANCRTKLILCYEDYGVLRRLLATHPAEQLDAILVTHTDGYMGEARMLPDSEVTLIQDYFMNIVHLPVTIGIWKSSFRMLPDGWAVLQPVPTEQAYRPPDDPQHITIGVLDRHGAIRLYTTLSPQNEIMLDDVVKAVITQP